MVLRSGSTYNIINFYWTEDTVQMLEEFVTSIGLKTGYGGTIITERDEDELPEEDEKRCRRLLPLTSDSLEMLRIYSVGRRQKWGEKRIER